MDGRDKPGHDEFSGTEVAAYGKSRGGWKTKPAGRPASQAASAGGRAGFHRLASKRQPLTRSASREATKRIGGTISSGSTRRATRPAALASRISSAMPGVFAPAPGLTMLTVRPLPSASLAHTSVAISSPAFDAPYGWVPTRFIVSSLVVTLTMRPQPRST